MTTAHGGLVVCRKDKKSLSQFCYEVMALIINWIKRVYN